MNYITVTIKMFNHTALVEAEIPSATQNTIFLSKNIRGINKMRSISLQFKELADTKL